MTTRRDQLEELFKDFQSIKRKVAETSVLKAKGELAPAQWLTLKIIYKSTEGVGIKEIAQTMGISSSAATQAVNALEKKGYIERKPSPLDRRNILITLSAEARQKISMMQEQAREMMLPWFDALSDQEFLQYCRLTKKIAMSFSSLSPSQNAK